LAWLREQCYCDAHRLSGHRATVLWQADRNGELVWMDYDEVLGSRQARAQWLQALADYGIAFLRGVPCQDGQVLEVARLIGYVRETNYGKVFDVRSVANPNNLAYSDLRLGLHIDNPYRDPVPGLQIHHCVQASDEGDDSLFADGFALAKNLNVRGPEAFEILSRVPVPFVFRDDSAQLRAERCLLELSASGELAAIHYNDRSIAPFCLPPEELSHSTGRIVPLPCCYALPSLHFRSNSKMVTWLRLTIGGCCMAARGLPRQASAGCKGAM